MDLAGPLPLDEDVLHLVLKELRYDSPASLYATCLVSRRFNSLSTPYLYRSVIVGDDKTGVRRDAAGEPNIVVEDVETLGRASEKKVSREEKLRRPSDALHSFTLGRLEKMKKYTREVVVKGHVSRLQLVELLMSMQQFEHLKWAWWAETLPAVVINRFSQRWPNASLSLVDFPVTSAARFPDPIPPPFAPSGPSPTQYVFHPGLPRRVSSFDILAHCSNLRSFKATINAVVGAGFASLLDFLVNCPNLKEVQTTLRKIGRNVLLISPSSSMLSNNVGKLPSLEELTMERYVFSLKSSFWDMSQLRRLTLRDISTKTFLRTGRGRALPRLEVFRLEERCIWGAEDLQENLAVFLLDLPSLHVLSLSGVVGRIPMSVITTHGQTLRSLQLQETYHWMQTRGISSAGGTTTSCPMLSLEDINSLVAECPHLESLTLDMARGADWPWPLLEALVLHETLRFLTLYTSINTVSSEEAIGSQILKVNKASAQHLFLQLRAMKRGKPLEKLHINLGEWNRIRHRASEHLHPLDDRCGNLFTCSMDYQSGEVVVNDAWAELRARFTRRDLWCFDQFIEPLDAAFLPDLRGRY